jgi:CotH kinase protein/Lamin Tail Domain
VKIKNFTIAGFIVALVFFARIATAQNFYADNYIQKIELEFSQSNWDYILDSLKNSSEDYLMANWVRLNGVQYDSVGVKYKGNSSYNATNAKNPLNISLDKFKTQKHLGFENIKLSNSYGDPSCIREVMGYNILKNYMHCSDATFAQVTINGLPYGLFSSAENIDKKFLGDHFQSSNNSLIKCNPTGAPTPALKSSLQYSTNDSTGYLALYELKSDSGWFAFINLCKSITNNTTSLKDNLDLDRAIWMLAFNNVFINLDSYNGVYAQNHYCYLDNTKHFNPIIWDLNMCFGAFPYAGTGTIGVGQKTLVELKNYSPFAHATDIAWPLINAIQSDATLKRKYLAHYKTIFQEQIVSANYQSLAANYKSIIDTAVASDLNKFFTYTQFQNGLSGDVTFGSFTVPGINNLLEDRKAYLNTITEFITQEPIINIPVFNNITPTIAPNINTNVKISVAIANANSNGTYMGFRFNQLDKFVPLPLFDDGLHNDGLANDAVFGNIFIMAGAKLEYYIYSENSTIGKFLPARAEHEFLELVANSKLPQSGELVINEILAENNKWNVDEYNDHEDWIELYNTTNQVLDLSTTFLSNDVLNFNRWKFPSGTAIAPKSYLTIYADDDTTEMIYHTNFNLNKTNGTLVLSIGNAILDSISFANQSGDSSFGRMPNGIGNFSVMIPTFGFANNTWALGTNSNLKTETFTIFPNPAEGATTLLFNGDKHIKICNIYGQAIISETANSIFQFNTRLWAKGTYLVFCGNGIQKLIVSE